MTKHVAIKCRAIENTFVTRPRDRTKQMHADQVETSPELVHRLLIRQFPNWANQPIQMVESNGTDHDIYRVGGRWVVRLPIVGWATSQAAKERRWLPKLAPQLPLNIPVQVANGYPSEGYPFEWSIYEWLPGANANEALPNLTEAATILARFVNALQNVATTDAHPRPAGARGGSLEEHDEQVGQSIDLLAGRMTRG